ncbi:MAG: S-adenosylmethionine:tRNA ribosyltransferase-isomerase [Nannocystis sp.]|nr:S-adenosylmethionine:tRNA ribosyltransferase-isomerase [Nannocystis sp.]MBA3550547.1 S-adenosylmethionine:tRNA ribosyltransferase-isomerase [Nannocystis sp.]
MQPATTPRHDRSDTRLLAVDRDSGSVRDLVIDDLPGLLRAGDLLVVNDAATLPASLHARVAGSEPMFELRLTGALTDSLASLEGPLEGPLAVAVLLGAGDWRTPTEHRAAPPRLAVGDTVLFQGPGPEGHDPKAMPDLRATITAVDPRAARLVTLRFDRGGAALWSALYRLGRPVQYSYLREPLALWSVQTGFAARPWAAEMPSAGRPLSWSTLLALRRAGVEVGSLTHAAGLSSTGDPQLDALLPLPERYDLPAATALAVTRARARGGRVIAAGTTVVRALEGCVARHGALRAGPGETDLVLGAEFSPRVVDGLLTGMHDPSERHFQLLRAFAGAPVLLAAWRHASAAGYLQHEFGDATLLAPALLA